MEHKVEDGSGEPGVKSGVEIRPSNRFLGRHKFLAFFVGTAIVLLGLSWVFLDESVAASVSRWLEAPAASVFTYSVIAILVLASDLFLPVPSIAVITHAGIFLGAIGGTLVGFVGLTLGSLAGFGFVRLLGKGWIEKKVSVDDVRALNRMANHYGVFIIVLLRPIPILAEASVLMLSAGQMSWRPFLIWLSISNLFVAFFFSTFGQWSKQNGIGELPALLIGIAIPILLLILFRLLASSQLKQ